MLPAIQRPITQIDISKFIWCQNVLTDSECDQIRDEVLLSTSGLKNSVNEFPEYWQISFKTTQLPLNHWLVNRLNDTWLDIQKFFAMDLEFIENYEVKQYNTSDYVSNHIDQFYNLVKERKLTMVIQISDKNAYTGGDLLLFKSFPISKEKGSITVFPSTFYHQVTEIKSGQRYSVNNWAWGDHWR